MKTGCRNPRCDFPQYPARRTAIARMLFFAAFSFLFAALLTQNVPASPVSGDTALSARKGVMDCRHIDFSRSGVIKLDGEWEFYWKKIIGPANFSAKDPLFLTGITGSRSSGQGIIIMNFRRKDMPRTGCVY